MDGVRAVITDMRTRETALYAIREKQTETSQRRTLLSIYALTLVSLAGLLVLCGWILCDINQRERHAAEIQEREQTLQLAASCGQLAALPTNTVARSAGRPAPETVAAAAHFASSFPFGPKQNRSTLPA